MDLPIGCASRESAYEVLLCRRAACVWEKQIGGENLEGRFYARNAMGKKKKKELPLTPRDTHLACLATPGPHRATTTVGTINARRVNAIRFKLAIEGKSNRCQKPRAASCIYSCIAPPQSPTRLNARPLPSHKSPDGTHREVGKHPRERWGRKARRIRISSENEVSSILRFPRNARMPV